MNKVYLVSVNKPGKISGWKGVAGSTGQVEKVS